MNKFYSGLIVSIAALYENNNTDKKMFLSIANINQKCVFLFFGIFSCSKDKNFMSNNESSGEYFRKTCFVCFYNCRRDKGIDIKIYMRQTLAIVVEDNWFKLL